MTCVIKPGIPGLRRSVLIEPRPGGVRAAVEDDFHHFIVDLDHREGLITSVEAVALRFPWTLCFASSSHLQERLIGVPLDEAGSFDSPFSHCTHQFDLAAAAALHARDTAPTLFTMFVADPVGARSAAELHRNGVPSLRWELDGQEILAPAGLNGLNLRKLKEWISLLSEAEQEETKMLRRAVLIASGRQRTSEAPLRADSLTGFRGACYVFQPERAVNAYRRWESDRDFSQGDAVPLSDRP